MAWTTPQNFTTGQLVDEADMDAISDNLAALLPVDQVEWDTWTPTLTNFTLGNGTLVARYTQLAKTVIGQITFTLGSTSAVGTAGTFSVPVTAGSGYTVAQNIIGPCHLFDTSAGTTHSGGVRLESTTTLRPFVNNAAGTFVTVAGLSSTSPFTWATGDILQFSFCYEAA